MRTLLLASLLCFATPAVAEVENAESMQLAWDQTCAGLTEIYPKIDNCKNILGPYVIFSAVTYYYNSSAGLYIYGEDVVFIHPNAEDTYKVMVHEMSHYAMHMSGVNENMNVCEREAVVRSVAGHPWTAIDKIVYGCKEQ